MVWVSQLKHKQFSLVYNLSLFVSNGPSTWAWNAVALRSNSQLTSLRFDKEALDAMIIIYWHCISKIPGKPCCSEGSHGVNSMKGYIKRCRMATTGLKIRTSIHIALSSLCILNNTLQCSHKFLETEVCIFASIMNSESYADHKQAAKNSVTTSNNRQQKLTAKNNSCC